MNVSHRRSVLGLDVVVALDLSIRMAKQHQRATAMGVEVGVRHRGAPDNHGLVEKRGVTFGGVLQLVQEVRKLPYTILADLVVLEDRLFAATVMRSRVERFVDAAFREYPVIRIASRLERNDSRH